MPAHTNHLFAVEGLDETMLVLRFDGTEGISELFQFDVSLSCTASDLAFDDVVGKAAVLTFATPEGEDPRQVHGIVARFEEVEPTKRGALYRATVVPRCWKLQHRRDSRIFQEMTAPAVIQKVFEGAGLASGDDFRMSLQGNYVAREYCVQYHESDWDFVSRLMEEEGIFYWFEHASDKHVLVLGDSLRVHAPIAGDQQLVYRPVQGALVGQGILDDSISAFNITQEIRPGKVTLRDFNFKKPALLLESKNAAKVDADLEIYDYPGEYDLPAGGDARSQIRIEEAQTARRTGAGVSACPRLVPGCVFSLAEHPRESFNEKYLLTRIEHHGHEPTEHSAESSFAEEPDYVNRFEVIPSEVPFRPSRLTRRPAIRGVQTAIVVGPSGEEIYTDEHGRVKVQFHWDRLGKKNEKSSCWIRVSQLWAGEGWGAMFIPRIDQEVVVSFEEGDPDRPMIVGRLYHGTNVPPYPLPANKTKSTIKSNSSSGGGGSNELRFEDKKGAEEIFLHAQKDWTITTENDKAQLTGHDETLQIKNDRTKTVDHDQAAEIKHDDTLTVGNDRKVTVKNDHTEEIDGNQTSTVKKNQTLTVNGDQSEKIDGKQSLEVGGDQSFKLGGKQSIEVSGDTTQSFGGKAEISVSHDRTEKVSGKGSLAVTGDVTEKYDAKYTLTVGADAAEEYKSSRTVKVTDTFTIECGQSKLTMKADGTIKIEGMSFELKCNGAVKINGLQIDAKANTTIKIEAAAKLDLKAALVDLNSSGMLKVGAPMIRAG